MPPQSNCWSLGGSTTNPKPSETTCMYIFAACIHTNCKVPWLQVKRRQWVLPSGVTWACQDQECLITTAASARNLGRSLTWPCSDWISFGSISFSLHRVASLDYPRKNSSLACVVTVRIIINKITATSGGKASLFADTVCDTVRRVGQPNAANPLYGDL